MNWRAWLAALALSACTTESDPPPKPEQRASVVETACAPDFASEVREEILRTCRIDQRRPPAGVAVVDHPYQERSEGAVTVSVKPDGRLLIHGVSVPEELRSETRALIRGLRPTPTESFRLEISADAPSLAVVPVLEDLIALGLDEGVLVFASKGKTIPPPPPDARRVAAETSWLRPMTGNQRAVEAGGRITNLLYGCDPAYDAWHQLEHLPLEEHCEAMAEGLAEGLASCGCPPRQLELRSLIYASNLLDAEGRSIGEIPVRLDPSRPFPNATPWYRVVEALELDAEPVVLGLDVRGQ